MVSVFSAAFGSIAAFALGSTFFGADAAGFGCGAASVTTFGRLRTPVQGSDGNLYVTTSNGSNDRILVITPS